MSTDREEKIRQRAYELWERDGAQLGRDQDYWHEAAEQIDAEERTAAVPESSPARPRRSFPKMPKDARAALEAAQAAAKAHGVDLADVMKPKKAPAKKAAKPRSAAKPEDDGGAPKQRGRPRKPAPEDAADQPGPEASRRGSKRQG